MRFLVFVAVNLIAVSAIWLRALWWKQDDDQPGQSTPTRVTRARRRYAIRPAPP
jgi:hypothetical protein